MENDIRAAKRFLLTGVQLSEQFNFMSLQKDYWDSPWQNRHAFVWELSKRHPVFFLSPPFYLPQLFDSNVPKKTGMQSGLKQIKDNLWSYVPSRFLPTNYRFPRVISLFDPFVIEQFAPP